MNKSLYHVRHKTVYKYSSLVTLSHHLARLKPRETPHQHISNATLSIDVPTSFVNDDKDCFGNRTTFFIAETPHTSLTVISEFNAEISTRILPQFYQTPSWESVSARLPATQAQLEVMQMIYPSRFIALTPQVKQYASLSMTQSRAVLDVAWDLTQRIYTDFVYDPSATSISTPVNDVLKLRRGVCQDFAHLAVACLRTFGLSARYVSGYIRTHRSAPIAQSMDIEMIGGDASHAWFSIYVPDLGWVDFDPTNNMLVGLEHITTGWGRDFDDLSPIKGVMTGGGNHIVSVDVSVLPISEQ